MLIPKNHERLQVVSDVVRENLARHADSGGKYYDDQANSIAADAIMTCMPELVELQESRVDIEALRAISVGEEVRPLDGAFVSAVFRTVRIQQILETMQMGDDEVQMSDFDLCAIIVPVYRDPDPVDIVLGDELYVPFAHIERFEPAA